MSDDVMTEDLLRSVARSLCIRFGTTAPYAIGTVRAERVGYAQIPRVVVEVFCRERDVDSLVPIVRQRVFGELAERGWPDEHVAFRPSVGLDNYRSKRFLDENESSESCGKFKMGNRHVFGFDMDRILATATFTRGSFARIPDRHANPAKEDNA